MAHVEVFSPEHQEGVISTILPIQQAEFGVPITLADQPDLLDIRGAYQRGAGNFWVALDAGEVVGTIGLFDIGASRGALRKMFVRRAYRGGHAGVAQALLDTLLQWCKRHELVEVLLGTTAQFVAAHRFYEKNGFTEIARADLPASFPAMVVDTKFYARTLR